MANQNQSQLSRRVDQFNEYREWASLVQQQTDKNLFTQLREISALKGYGGKCGVSDSITLQQLRGAVLRAIVDDYDFQCGHGLRKQTVKAFHNVVSPVKPNFDPLIRP